MCQGHLIEFHQHHFVLGSDGSMFGDPPCVERVLMLVLMVSVNVDLVVGEGFADWRYGQVTRDLVWD